MFIIQLDRKAEQERTNVTNITKRHCRIGKVREKTGIPWMDRHLFPTGPQPIIPGVFTLPQMSQPKCGCKPGTVCGNVACPHLPVVTCAA